MSFEQGLILALGAVTSALVFLYQDLRKRSQLCEDWRNQQEPVIRDLSKQVGALNGAMSLFRNCKTPNCMFTGIVSTAGETFSVKNKSKSE
jgi:hypothetical protein